ncbi:MAG TPA: hypothetical protein EYP69_03535, partial [Bacteroidales bacterium]|nr:hypothetical protein [Bacteroidales bacterium]
MRMHLLMLTKTKKFKQITSLYSSLVLGIIISICVSVINTRLLGPKQYGDLKFLQNLFIFVATCSTIGIFISGGRLLALKENARIKNQLIGSLFFFASVISILLIVFVFIFSFFEEQIFDNELGRIIKIFSPLLFVFPFQFCLQNIMQGDNRIFELSIFNVGPRIFYVFGAILLNFFIPLSLILALALQFLGFMIFILIMIVHFRPKFINIKRNLTNIWKENKIYGLHVYIGILAGVASAQFGGLTIGYFIDNLHVGFFSLAITSTMPLAMIP